MQILNLFEGLSPNLNDDIVDLWDEVIPRLTAYLEKQSVSCVLVCVLFFWVVGGWWGEGELHASHTPPFLNALEQAA